MASPLAFLSCSRFSTLPAYLGLVWHEQIQPGRLQSGCRGLAGEGSAQKAESTGGQTPRGYPGQEVPVGSGDVSGMCLVTDIRARAYQFRSSPVFSKMLTFLATVRFWDCHAKNGQAGECARGAAASAARPSCQLRDAVTQR